MDYDVIVVGAGNAALAANAAAREAGAGRVLVLEKAPREQRGGNTHFSGGLFRFAFENVQDLTRLVPDAEERYPGFNAGIEPYTQQEFLDDLMRMTDGRTDPELAELLISRSYETVCWLHEMGKIPLEPAVSLGAVRVGDVLKWPKGAILRALHEGVGLSNQWFATTEELGVEIRYDTGAERLTQDERGRVTGLVVRTPDGRETLTARAVVLASGGFETNISWRASYLGRPWDQAKVRGSSFNHGDGLRMALEIGALPYGQWSGCHATPIDAEAPDYGRRDLTDKTNRLSYPYGVMLNLTGRRFVDEAPDFQFFTYAKYGGLILNQPGSLIYQIFDSKVTHLLEPRYATSEPFRADTLPGLIDQLKLDRRAALETLAEYNEAAGHGEFNPGVLDGMHTEGLAMPKSNWAQKLDEPPFLAYPVTGGITFTFGGLKVNDRAQVIGTDWRPIPGLYTCGEMVGGLFHNNYPGGTGLTSGAVFGRIAGTNAAA